MQELFKVNPRAIATVLGVIAGVTAYKTLMVGFGIGEARMAYSVNAQMASESMGG